MSARDQVLGAVRRSLGATGAERPRLKAVEDRLARPPLGVIPARAAARGPRERIALFVEMALASAATVDVVRDEADAPAAVAAYLRAHNLAPEVRRGGDPRLARLPWATTALTLKEGRTYGDDPVGLSAAFGGVAETGTLLLASGPDNPTSLNFLPDNHVVVLDAADVGATYEELWARLRARYGAGVMPRVANWITGPSRSADIEQILLMGAHGPRRLHIVLIDPEHAAAKADGDAAVPAGSTPAGPVGGSTLAVAPSGGDDEERAPEPPPPSAPSEKQEEDEKLDEELDESFPASDPPSQTQP
ncbi:LutC/YkgG family protein [Methylopila jiangsuensis]|nr:lactate utilization protein [Methylopila jiangsuensis]